MNNDMKEFQDIVKYIGYARNIEVYSMKINSIYRGRIDHYNTPFLDKHNRWVYLVNTSVKFAHKTEGYIVDCNITIPLYCSSGTNSGKKEGQLYPFLGLKPNSPELANILCEKVAGTNLNNVSKHWIMKSPFYSHLREHIPGVTTYNKAIPKEMHDTYGYGFTYNSIVFKKFAEECNTFSGEIKDCENHYEFTQNLNSIINGENNLNMIKLAVLTLSMIGVNADLNSLHKYLETA